MAELTTSQNISGSMKTGKDRLFALLQKMVINILKRFRFLEVGEVTNLDVSNYMVRCRLLTRKDTSTGEGRITKWLKVYSVFASDDEGIVAMPNIGDYGVVFFRNGDQCGGMFYGMHFGQKKVVPNKNKGDLSEELHQRDLMLKRNGSWVLIDGADGDEVNRRYADIELWHKDENYARITKGFEVFHVEDNVQVDIQRWSNHHTQGKEYKICSWIRSKNVTESAGEVYGEVQNIKMRRRKITVTPPVVCCGGGFNQTVEDTFDSDKLDPIVTEQHVTDKTRKVKDAVIDKTLIKPTADGNRYIFKMSRHEASRTVERGTDLTALAPAEFGTQMTVDANLNFLEMAHSVITTLTDSNQSFILMECWFKDNYAYYLMGANENYAYIDSKSQKDGQFLEFKKRFQTFSYEIGEFDMLVNTDSLVNDDIEQRNITGAYEPGNMAASITESGYYGSLSNRVAFNASMNNAPPGYDHLRSVRETLTATFDAGAQESDPGPPVSSDFYVPTPVSFGSAGGSDGSMGKAP